MKRKERVFNFKRANHADMATSLANIDFAGLWKHHRHEMAGTKKNCRSAPCTRTGFILCFITYYVYTHINQDKVPDQQFKRKKSFQNHRISYC